MFFESRRNFLKGTALAVGGVAVAKGVFSGVSPELEASSEFSTTPENLDFYPPFEEWKDFNELDGDDWKRGGIDRKGIQSEKNPDGIKVNNFTIVPTACSNCEASCGLTAWVDKETMTVKKYMGNPLHAGSRGRNCAKGYATQSQMYDPDRIPFPLKRAEGSKRGEGKWVRTTWDEAMTTIGKKMGDTLRNGDELSKKSVMFHVGRPNENGFTGKVWHTLGVDSFNSHTNICSSGGRTPTIQWANDDRSSPDWANAKLIFLNSSHAADAGHYFQQSASFIADARKKGAKMVVMDPRLSNSAGIADLWIAAWPGTEPIIYLYIANRILQEGKVDNAFVKNWVNWDRFIKNKNYLEFIAEKGYISEVPTGETYEDFIEVLKELYAPYTLDYASEETHVPKEKLEALYDMFIWAGDAVSTYFWRAAAAGNRGGWMSGRAGFLPLVLRGAIGSEGGTFFHHWHVISVAGKGGKSTVGNGDVPKVDHWNELAWPPEWPLSTYEMSYLLPHLLADEEWQQKWTARGLKVPTKLSVWIPRMYNPVWINPDGFRWIDVLKDESKMELTFNLSPTWSETNWYVDYILPVGLAGERHDQHSEATMPGRWTSFRQPVLRVAMEQAGWKAKNPNRATLEAHIKAGLGEIWEENEFWMDMAVNYIDPTGDLGVRKHWESKKHAGKPVTIAEWYDAAFSKLPNLVKTAKAKYPDAEYPVYSYMRDHGTWLEEDKIYHAQKRELHEKVEEVYDASTDTYITKECYVSHGHKYNKKFVTKDEYGTLIYEQDGHKKAIGVEVDGKLRSGFATLSKKLEFFSEWLAEWKWPEYAIPFYPRNEEEKESMVHLVSHVHHKYMTEKNDRGEKNSFALNTVFRLPYNIHTRSVNSKHLMEISQNHDPIWISTGDAERLGFKRGDAVKVKIVDSVSGLDSGYFVGMAVPTEGVLPGTLACSHHGGRWRVVNSVEIQNGNEGEFQPEGFTGQLGVMGIGAPLAELEMVEEDGKVGKLRWKEGIKSDRKPWQFAEYNKDIDNIWWDGLSGAWQNAVAAPHPDPISGMHCWHQKVLLEPVSRDEKIGDVYVNYDNNLKVYQAWRDELTRPLNSSDKLRRPMHIKRPWVPISKKGYSVEIKDV
jgi:anaerobic selenocysteine-containing dehydrogenase